MTPELTELIALVPPPALPEGAGTVEQWAAVEQKLGTILPEDYKQLLSIYGVGWFANWICIYSPFSTRFPLERPEQWEILRNDGGYPEYHHRFPVFPASGGLLPCGEDDNRGLLCWLTQGPPDAWQIVSLDGHYSHAYRLLPFTVTSLLAGWFSGRITGDWYPEDMLPTQERVFQQGEPRY